MLRWYTLNFPAHRRQHDALCTLVFGYNVRYHSTLTLPVDVYGSLSAVARNGRPLNNKLCPPARPRQLGWLEKNDET